MRIQCRYRTRYTREQMDRTFIHALGGRTPDTIAEVRDRLLKSSNTHDHRTAKVADKIITEITPCTDIPHQR